MNKEQTNSIYEVNTWLYFLALCLVTFLLLFMKKTLIENETAAFQILDQRGELGIIQMLNGLQYIAIPLIYLIKFTVIAFVIWVGCFMFGYKITFGQTWHVTLVSESIFLVAELLKICWFLFIETDPILYEIQAFYPLSLIHFADIYSLSKNLFYPLKALNIFEVAYWFLLVYGIHQMAQKRKNIAYAIIFTSYVPFFLLWLVFYSVVYK